MSYNITRKMEIWRNVGEKDEVLYSYGSAYITSNIAILWNPKELNCDTAQFYPMFVYPGTEAFDLAKKNGYLETEDYSKLIDENGNHDTILKHPNYTKDEILEYCNEARKGYYLRWRYMIPKLWQCLKSPSEFVRTLKSAKVFFKYLRR